MIEITDGQASCRATRLILNQEYQNLINVKLDEALQSCDCTQEIFVMDLKALQVLL